MSTMPALEAMTMPMGPVHEFMTWEPRLAEGGAPLVIPTAYSWQFFTLDSDAACGMTEAAMTVDDRGRLTGAKVETVHLVDGEEQAVEARTLERSWSDAGSFIEVEESVIDVRSGKNTKQVWRSVARIDENLWEIRNGTMARDDNNHPHYRIERKTDEEAGHTLYVVSGSAAALGSKRRGDIVFRHDEAGRLLGRSTTFEPEPGKKTVLPIHELDYDTVSGQLTRLTQFGSHIVRYSGGGYEFHRGKLTTFTRDGSDKLYVKTVAIAPGAAPEEKITVHSEERSYRDGLLEGLVELYLSAGLSQGRSVTKFEYGSQTPTAAEETTQAA